MSFDSSNPETWVAHHNALEKEITLEHHDLLKGQELEITKEEVASCVPSAKKDIKVASSLTTIKEDCNEK